MEVHAIHDVDPSVCNAQIDAVQTLHTERFTCAVVITLNARDDEALTGLKVNDTNGVMTAKKRGFFTLSGSRDR